MKILLSASGNKENYARAVEKLGCQAVFNDYLGEIAQYDGLILCGGADVHPRYYAQEILGSVGIDEERDSNEFALVEKFMQTGKPIFGICRGMQLLNVALGGTLIQHLPTTENHRDKDAKTDIYHDAFARKGGLFYELYGEKLTVNSFHHQGLGELGKGLIATLLAPDGVVEGVEHTQKPYFGVQFHPERMTAETGCDGSAFFEKFVGICREMRKNI